MGIGMIETRNIPLSQRVQIASRVYEVEASSSKAQGEAHLFRSGSFAICS